MSKENHCCYGSGFHILVILEKRNYCAGTQVGIVLTVSNPNGV